MNLKVSGDLPLTAFFSRANKTRDSRRRNSEYGTRRISPKRKSPDQLQPEKGPKRRIVQHRSRQATTDNPSSASKKNVSGLREKSLLLPSHSTASALFAPDIIEISDDDAEPSASLAESRTGSPMNRTRNNPQVLRRSATSASLTNGISRAKDSPDSFDTVPKQPEDRPVYSHPPTRDGFFATSAPCDQVVPSSQPTDDCIVSPPSIQESSQPPTFKIPNIPLDLATKSPIAPLDDFLIPSSQSQSIITFRTSPRKPGISRISSNPTSVLASPSGGRGSTDRVVQSSQSQSEGASVFCWPSPTKRLAHNQAAPPMSCINPSSPISTHPVTVHNSPATPESDEAPKSSWPSPSPSVSFTPSVRIPSDIEALLDSDDERPFLPTPLRGYRDIFKDGASMAFPSNIDQYQSSPSKDFSLESFDSATESDSGMDDSQVSLLTSLPNVSFSSNDAKRQPEAFRLASPIPPTNRLGIDYSTSPISIPADLTSGSNSMTFSDDGTSISLPTPVKRFRDIFRRNDP